ncbi:hypothetical protein [Phycicoccus flavus]|uniref:hypothetical protein n=1 Tax=Phycicoccus flavus TaxID=2502783 RepID=UPI000FEBB06B|nr:hypothetical protein [Phycicoccus flavus]NHA67819.1 hypothetical protein [Phycicoccus flavus]
MTLVSHWTSGLPKLDIQPFDPSPLYAAVEETNRERAQTRARRRTRLLPALAVVGIAAVVGAVLGTLALMG